MPVDKLLAAEGALGVMYGLQIGLAPAKSAEAFYGDKAPSKATTGVAKFLGVSNIAWGTTMFLTAKSSDEELKKNVKALSAGFSLLGAGVAAHQVDANGFDKTQGKIAVGANLALAALLLKDVLGK